jgi:hypothetical protein
MVDDETRTVRVDVPDGEICPSAHNEKGGSGVDAGIVDFGAIQELPTTQREEPCDAEGACAYVREALAIVDGFPASNITRDRRTEALRGGGAGGNGSIAISFARG